MYIDTAIGQLCTHSFTTYQLCTHDALTDMLRTHNAATKNVCRYCCSINGLIVMADIIVLLYMICVFLWVCWSEHSHSNVFDGFGTQ